MVVSETPGVKQEQTISRELTVSLTVPQGLIERQQVIGRFSGGHMVHADLTDKDDPDHTRVPGELVRKKSSCKRRPGSSSGKPSAPSSAFSLLAARTSRGSATRESHTRPALGRTKLARPGC